MTYYILAIIIYEIFAAFQTEFFRLGISTPAYQQSAFERKIFSTGSNLDLVFSTFGTVARINGIAFLIYLGYKTIWWHPIVIWVFCLFAIAVLSRIFKGKTGFAIPALLAFLVLPISAAYLWSVV
ncbi:hypothetical protein MHO82_11275 [Vibrio sp. Of7-15]|uniref:hypothetical protein n=1 Tax=Vibrio sp. Of7-15 TaxID=2724879 RepID=UPI001EF1C849|nr:hypothetical protein [Vibrio sp. Of7-15]MCG7497448.1 hypothetical protein [Vibrio sp. Of7-15]